MKIENELVSVIIPIYNVENTLRHVLNLFKTDLSQSGDDID